uniref:PPM-type phosphatase domain-containing protein n=1 Tax=Angiostrongylus cantonensis TaxID=6313 RepID=A0A0K0CZU6_ANGCA
LNSRQLGFYSFHPVLTPKPTEKSILITKEMDYVIIASWAVWEFLNDAQISSILVSSLNPQVAAKTIQDSLQACDYNGNSCVMVIRLLKPELSFRSTSNESVGCSTSISMVIPPMRVEQRKTQEDALPKIEQNWIVSPNSSGAAPPPDPTYSGHSEFVNELKSRVGCVDFIQDRNEVSVVPQHPQNKQENISNLQYNNTVPLSKNLKGTMRQQCSPANSDVTSSAKYLRFPRLTSRQKQHSEITRPMSSKSKCLVGVYQYDDGLSINTDKHSHASPATSEDPWIERVVSRITHKHGAVYSLCSPATSSSSEFYSITKARKERRLASSEKFRRSFDYYSHTQIRPYSDAHEVLESPSVSGSDFFTPIRSMTPHLENTLPYNKRMSVIEEEVHQKFPSED